MNVMKTIQVSLIFILLFLSCERDSSDNLLIIHNGPPILLDNKYVLPYPVGKAYTCTQGFNTSYSHYGTFSYAVDFGMTIGTIVTAARSGQVVYILESFPDDDQTDGHENTVIVMHSDSTYARYVHLTFNGALVRINQKVVRGDTIGLSGSSGTNGGPHLHFDVTKTFAGRSDQTIPFDFINTISHPIGLQAGVSYEAFAY
jgi:murein DD-endopeptidase MepM/ murein hydrolase activator NlpD